MPVLPAATICPHGFHVHHPLKSLHIPALFCLLLNWLLGNTSFSNIGGRGSRGCHSSPCVFGFTNRIRSLVPVIEECLTTLL